MYVTVDLDAPTHDKIALAWRRVSAFGPTVGRVSKSGNGVHLKSRKTVPQDVPVRPLLRWYCLDDEKRIKEDKNATIKENQVLWDSTDGLSAGPWRQSLAELLIDYRVAADNLPEYYAGGRL